MENNTNTAPEPVKVPAKFKSLIESIEKLSRLMPVPPTREAVLTFIGAEPRTRRERLGEEHIP